MLRPKSHLYGPINIGTIVTPDPTDPYQVTTITARGTGAAANNVFSFAHSFKPGDVPAGSTLTLRNLSTDDIWRTAVTWQTTHADGSLKWGLIDTEIPAMVDAATQQLSVDRDNPHPSPGSNLSWATLTAGRTATCTISAGGGTPRVIDLIGEVTATTALNPLKVAKYGAVLLSTACWDGKSSGRVEWDIWITKNGKLFVDVAYCNDVVNPPDLTAGDVSGISIVVEIDGVEVENQTGKALGTYTAWLAMYGDDPELYWCISMHHNPTYWKECGFWNYNWENGYNASYPVTYAAIRADPDWYNFMEPTDATPDNQSIRLIPVNMDQTGARADIGPISEPGAIWVMDGNIDAQRFAMDQAERHLCAPWRMWLPNTQRWLNRIDKPSLRFLQADVNLEPKIPGTVNVGGPALTTPGFPHATSVNRVPLLFRGRLSLLRSTQAKTSTAISHTYEIAEPPVSRAEPYREVAWTGIDLAITDHCTPTSDPLYSYFHGMLVDSCTKLNSYAPTWTADQGELHGYFRGEYEDNRRIAIWMQAYGVTWLDLLHGLGFDVNAFMLFVVNYWTTALLITVPDGGGNAGFPLLATSDRLVISGSSYGPEYTTALEIANATNATFGVQTPAAQDRTTVLLTYMSLQIFKGIYPSNTDIDAALARMATVQYPPYFNSTTFQDVTQWSIVAP